LINPTEVSENQAFNSIETILSDPNLSKEDFLLINQALTTGDRSGLSEKQLTALTLFDQEVQTNKTFEKTLLSYLQEQLGEGESETIQKNYDLILSAYYSRDKGFLDAPLTDLNGVSLSQVLTTVTTLAETARPEKLEQLGPVVLEKVTHQAALLDLKVLLDEKITMLDQAIELTNDPSTLDLLSVIRQAVSEASAFLSELIVLNQKKAALFSKADYESMMGKLAKQAAEMAKQARKARKAKKMAKKMKIVQKVMIAVTAILIVATAGTMTGALMALTAFALVTIDQQMNDSGVMNAVFDKLQQGVRGIARGIGEILGATGMAEAREIQNAINGPMQFLFVAALLVAASYFGGGAGLAVAMGPIMESGGMSESIIKFWSSVNPDPIFGAVMTALTVLVLAIASGRLATPTSGVQGAASATTQGANAASKSVLAPLQSMKKALEAQLQACDEFFLELIKSLKQMVANFKNSAQAANSVTLASTQSTGYTSLQQFLMKPENMTRMMNLGNLLQGGGQISSSALSIRMLMYQKENQKSVGEMNEMIALAEAAHKVMKATIKALYEANVSAEGGGGLISDLETLQNLFKSTLRSQNLNGLYTS
jgi:hypothetical protein